MENEELLGYIQRSIPDIARKCGITNDEVVKAMHQYTSLIIVHQYTSSMINKV